MQTFPKAELRAKVAGFDDGELADFIAAGRALVRDTRDLGLAELALSWTCLVSVGLAERARRAA